MARTRIVLSCTVLSLFLFLVSCSKGIDVMAVRLNESAMTLKVGETAKLVAVVEPSAADYDGISWSSSDPSVVTVENGEIQVHKVGTAVIRASAGGVVSNICTITVDLEQVPEVAAEITPEEVGDTPETVASTEEPEQAEEPENAEEPESAETQEDPEPEITENNPETVEPEIIPDEPEPSEEVEETTLIVSGESFIYDVDFGEKGSFIDIDSLITVTDWRGRDFEDYPNYWGYYGPFEFTVDIANAECDLNGTRQTLPQSITLIQTEAGATTVKDPSSGSEVTLPANRHGFLICKFTTVGLTEGFNIFIKAKVKYGFGTIQTDWIAIPVVMGIPE
ncbi:MAG: Ig domain-containing protein [Bacteroidales bacterium]|nr:Ig domain-containing protein [Bacteroidales bacterium]